MKSNQPKLHKHASLDDASVDSRATSSGLRFNVVFWQIFVLLIGCSGLIWGTLNLPPSAASDSFRGLESSLLGFETFNRQTALATLNSEAAQKSNPCDVHSQRALMLLEIPLADTALRSGEAYDFDQHTLSLERRAKATLSCSPRDSLVWLLLFGLRNEHGLLDADTFELLAMSYATSPYEAWVGVRRIVVAMPVILAAPKELREKVLVEFQTLIRRGFVETPALAFLSAPAQVRSLLQARIDELDSKAREAFRRAIEKRTT
jgi:hypothetical protein